MKRLLVVLLVLSATSVWAQDNKANSFATGFADALTRSMGGTPYVAPAPVQQPVVVIDQPTTLEIHAIRSDGSDGPTFGTFQACRHYVQNTYGFSDCTSR